MGEDSPPYFTDHYRRRRDIVSEFLFVRSSDPDPNHMRFFGFRDVLKVDGRAVSDRTSRLEDLLTGSPELSSQQFDRLVSESARYNIGHV